MELSKRDHVLKNCRCFGETTIKMKGDSDLTMLPPSFRRRPCFRRRSFYTQDYYPCHEKYVVHSYSLVPHSWTCAHVRPNMTLRSLKCSTRFWHNAPWRRWPRQRNEGQGLDIALQLLNLGSRARVTPLVQFVDVLLLRYECAIDS